MRDLIGAIEVAPGLPAWCLVAGQQHPRLLLPRRAERCRPIAKGVDLRSPSASPQILPRFSPDSPQIPARFSPDSPQIREISARFPRDSREIPARFTTCNTARNQLRGTETIRAIQNLSIQLRMDEPSRADRRCELPPRAPHAPRAHRRAGVRAPPRRLYRGVWAAEQKSHVLLVSYSGATATC